MIKTATDAGTDNLTPSVPQYFSWINNTNEGSTEEHTLINLDFFRYLRLTGVEHITVSLVALFRIASHSFLKGVRLPANSCIATRKIRRQKLFDLPNREFFVLAKPKNEGILPYFK